MAYVWDDHDFGGDGANSQSDSAPAAESVYRRFAPHYPLRGGVDSGPIYQAFDVGRVRFLVTDTRSQRDPQAVADGPGKTMLGEAQKEWLKRELLRSDRYSLVVWVNPDPWIGAAEEGSDSWAGYAVERRELSAFIARNEIDNLLMLSGDAHMLAIDDGSNTDYSGTGDAGFPVMHAAALDRRGGVKGGPYSEGTFPGSGQYGLVTIRDEDGNVSVELSGRDYRGREILRHELSFAPPGSKG
jgi:phosphodiesterase/alkaline phosphatase D-like protein